MYSPGKFVALLLVAATGLTPAAGCLSVGIEKVGTPAAGLETGSLDVSISEHRPRNGKGDPPVRPILSELSRIDGAEPVPVRETSETRWREDGLRPGKYRLRVARAVQKTFSIRPGETVSAEVIVKRFPTGTVIGVGAAIAGGILVASLISAYNRSPFVGGSWKTSGKRGKKMELHTEPLPAPRVAPIPSAR